MLDRVRADELKRTELLAAISHEFWTPLAEARGHLKLLETVGPEDRQTAADIAAVARREPDRLGRVVDDPIALNAAVTRPESRSARCPRPTSSTRCVTGSADRVTRTRRSSMRSPVWCSAMWTG